MCGIAGIIGRQYGVKDKSVFIDRVSDILHHRGPDAKGCFEDEDAILIHRRLKIIDLSERAAQPMYSDDNRYVIVFNGEIYNYQHLKNELIKAGYSFSTSSDTEVLLKYYLHKGADGLKDLVGIFAFVVWDREERKLFAARDQVGVKPFYYAFDNAFFYFGSEMKAVLAAGWPASMDKEKVYESLHFGAVAGESTLFEGIKRLLPGCYLVMEKGKAPRIDKYYSTYQISKEPISQQDAVTKARALLDNAVNIQMISDVPVGTMCSGGLDSSALTALSARLTSRISSYCITIPYEGYDESQYGRDVSEYVNSNHHELIFDLDEAGKLLNTLIWLHDEPLRHPNSVPIFQISRLAKEEVTVLLSGEGSDEIFGGYGVYFNVQRALKLQRLPRPALRLMLAYAHSKNRPGQPILGAMQKDLKDVLIYLRSTADRNVMRKLFRNRSYDISDRYQLAQDAITAAAGDHINGMMYYDQQTHLQTLLDRQDKMCMGNSIEGRVPILDVNLFDFINSIPSHYKTERGNTKKLLRMVMEGKLPEHILYRPKYPFGVPLERYFIESKNNRATVDNMVKQSELVKQQIIDPVTLNRLINGYLKGEEMYSDLIWNFINLELWYRIYISKEMQPDKMQLPAYMQLTVN
ncbi:MAG TPA: asparagine synthase (glutamine-hydrolyzing) [Flavipsychrobacter sp.]|nr:asparagine synthase (glutamine-hydrolyzing) [Flavipsychrobacter sp.]